LYDNAITVTDRWIRENGHRIISGSIVYTVYTELQSSGNDGPLLDRVSDRYGRISYEAVMELPRRLREHRFGEDDLAVPLVHASERTKKCPTWGMFVCFHTRTALDEAVNTIDAVQPVLECKLRYTGEHGCRAACVTTTQEPPQPGYFLGRFVSSQIDP
jgi:hypothetical protein